MKKLFLPFCLLLSAFCLLPVSALAQRQKSAKNKNDRTTLVPKENKKVYTGILFGPTIDWLAPTTNEFDLQREKVKGGFIAGVNVDVSVVTQRYLYVSTGLLCKYLQGELTFENQYTFSYLDTAFVLPTVRTYQTLYLTIPTGIKFRTPPTKNCIFTGQLGLYHNFRISGKQFDNFILPNISWGNNYFITTEKIKNKDAALFAEAAYLGIGFEYEFAPKIRAFSNVNYSCQFGYFSSKAINNVSDAQFKAIAHSLHIVFGVLF